MSEIATSCVELLADSILAGVHGTPSGPWRSVARGTALALAARVAGQRDAARILLEVPDALQRSAPYLSVKRSLQEAGFAALPKRVTSPSW